MSHVSVTVRGRSPLPAYLAEQYAGSWVALRDGEVVASNHDHDALLADERVDESSDAVYHVPEQGSFYYF